MSAMKTRLTVSFLILLAAVIVDTTSCGVDHDTHRCPADITELALVSALKTDCETLAGIAQCNESTSKYRTYDGSCNHKDNKGSRFAEIDRLLPPCYEDGNNIPRQHGIDGQPLPNVRNLSVHTFSSKDVFAGYPIVVFQWGQWTSHDMLSTARNNGDCCKQNTDNLSTASDSNCFHIEVPSDDPILNGTCLNFVRTQAAKCSNNQTIHPRLQTNTVTTFIDSSQIYGSDDETARVVREPGGFLLRTKFDLFPPESNDTCYKRDGTNDYCFLTGDYRANQHTYLSAMHTLWLREHNRIAKELKSLKPNADNEEVFQTTRQLINSINQAVTYNEYIPILLGDDARRWKLLSTSGRSTYNPNINPSLLIEFTTAAFRLGHSQTPSEFPIGNKSVNLRFLLNSPGLVLDNFPDIIAAMAGHSSVFNQGTQAVDNNFSEEITRFMSYDRKSGLGEDLLSINLQRGRDHGLPPYVKVREFFGLPPVTGFNDTNALGPDGHELANVYKSVEDIDLLVGILYEPIELGLAGPTIRCLVGLQFHRLKYADYHFFDNNRQSGLNNEQVASIRGYKLAHMMCHHTNLKSIQRNVFEFPSGTNEEVDCAELIKTGLNLNLFV